jgi:hypothetical protein
MERTFDLLEQFSNVVETDSRTEGSQIARLDFERGSRALLGRRHQSASKCVVDDVAERASRLSGARPQLRGHVVIQRERRSHIMMLD